MKQLLACLCLSLLMGCGFFEPKSPSVHQATRIISEQEARQLATNYANQFLKDKTYKDTKGAEHPFPSPFSVPSTWHHVKQTPLGWSLTCEPPAGPFAHVVMDLQGKNVRVTRHGFAHE
jgi:hypothetical protein